MKDLGPIEKNGKLLKQHLWKCDCGQLIVEVNEPTHDCEQNEITGHQHWPREGK